MEYAHVSAKFPKELNAEIERFLDETGFYTNKSEFMKEACRSHLRDVNSDAVIVARRAEQLLAHAEQNPADADTLTARLEELGQTVDPDDLAESVAKSREKTADSIYGQ